MQHLRPYLPFIDQQELRISWDSFGIEELSEQLHMSYTFHGNVERMLPAGVSKESVEALVRQAFGAMIENFRTTGPTKFLIRDRMNKYAVRGVLKGGVDKTFNASNDLTPRGDNRIGSNFNKALRKESFVAGLKKEKGFGFVKGRTSQEDDLFFHRQNMHVTSFDELHDRDVVEYQKGRDQKTGGDAAIKVTLMNDKKTAVVGELLSFDQYRKIMTADLDPKYDSQHLFYLKNRLASIKDPVEPGDFIYDVITVHDKTLFHPNTPTDIVIDIEEEGPVVRYINGKWK